LTKIDLLTLRHSDWGEADRLLVIYSPQLGKSRVVAKGVRRLRSRKAGHLEPFTRVNLLLARGRDLLLVTQAEPVEAEIIGLLPEIAYEQESPWMRLLNGFDSATKVLERRLEDPLPWPEE